MFKSGGTVFCGFSTMLLGGILTWASVSQKEKGQVFLWRTVCDRDKKTCVCPAPNQPASFMGIPGKLASFLLNCSQETGAKGQGLERSKCIVEDICSEKAKSRL